MIKHRGFTLVELMVGLALGSLLLLGILKIFEANLRGHQLLIADTQIQDSARILRSTLLYDIQNTGAVGCKTNLDSVYHQELFQPPDHPDFGFTDFVPFRLYNNVAENSTIGNVSALHTDEDAKVIEANTDVISLIRAVRVKEQLTAVNKNNAFVKMTGSPFSADDYLLLISCQGQIIGEIFQVQSVENKTLQKINLNMSVSQDKENLLSDENKQLISTMVYRLEVISYFVAESIDSTNNDRKLSLFRKINNKPAVEYIPGVDDFQISYEIINENSNRRSMIAGNDSNTIIQDLASVIHFDWVLRSDNFSNSNQFQGSATGKTAGQQYPKDGKLRRQFAFSGTIRNR